MWRLTRRSHGARSKRASACPTRISPRSVEPRHHHARHARDHRSAQAARHRSDVRSRGRSEAVRSADGRLRSGRAASRVRDRRLRRRSSDFPDAGDARRGRRGRREARATWPAARHFRRSAFSSSASCQKDLPVVLAALKKAGLELITQAPIDRLDRSRTGARSADRCGPAVGAPDRQRDARARMDSGVPRRRGSSDAGWARFARSRRWRARSTRPSPRPATKTSSASRSRACCPRQRRHDPGGLGAVRAEAGAGRADVWRRRHRLGVARRRLSQGRRRSPVEEIRRSIRAAGFEPVERDGSFDRRDDGRSTMPRFVSEPSAI